MEKSTKYIRIIRFMLLGINLAVTVLIIGVIVNATAGICSSMKAREFLGNVGNVPRAPELSPFFCMILFMALLALMITREFLFKKNQTAVFISCLIEILICCGIAYFLDMNHKGILLLAMSSLFLYIEDNKTKIILVSIILILFIFIDNDIIKEFLPMCSFNDYIQYYRASIRFILVSIKNLLISLNEMAFIIFIFFVLQQEIARSHKLQELYEKLYKNREELKLANLQLEEYAIRSEKMAETRERNRLAGEIHDTLGHVLTGISMGLEACIALIDVDAAKTRRQLEHISETARSGLLDVRRSVKALRPDALERLELKEALQKLTQDINKVTDTRVSLSFEDDNSITLSADEEETLYRIVQESITNSVRHGGAMNIEVNLIKTPGRAIVQIIDDGKGCAEITEGFGLRHIKERVGLLNGTVEFESDKGFKTKASIPIRIGEASND